MVVRRVEGDLLPEHVKAGAPRRVEREVAAPQDLVQEGRRAGAADRLARLGHVAGRRIIEQVREVAAQGIRLVAQETRAGDHRGDGKPLSQDLRHHAPVVRQRRVGGARPQVVDAPGEAPVAVAAHPTVRTSQVFRSVAPSNRVDLGADEQGDCLVVGRARRLFPGALG